MSTIALLTDFGLIDNFVGVMKGVILRINPRVNIIDITHEIPPRDISGAAFLLKGSFKYFSEGTVFLTVVDPGVGSARRAIIIRTRHYFFIGPDNGVLSLAAREDGVSRIIAVENKRYFLEEVCDTFHGRDIFASVAAHLCRDKDCNQFGPEVASIEEIDIPRPEKSRIDLKGQVIYIDRFGNLVTNIDKTLFEDFVNNGRFMIKFKDVELNSISRSYCSTGQNSPLAIFGSFGYLELSVNGGSAEEYFGASRGMIIRVFRI